MHCLEETARFELAPQGFAVPCITVLLCLHILAALRGFEPQLPESEAGVLPLDERAIIAPPKHRQGTQ